MPDWAVEYRQWKAGLTSCIGGVEVRGEVVVLLSRAALALLLAQVHRRPVEERVHGANASPVCKAAVRDVRKGTS